MATVNDTKPTDLELENVIDKNAAQLSALLANTYGGAGESFREMNDQLQDAYMWACADMANAIAASLDELSTRRMAKRERAEVHHG